MAISFDESDDYFTITDAASMTLQDGDWCVIIWTKVDDNTGSSYQYVVSNGNVPTANNSFNIWLGEASEGGNMEDKWTFRCEDGDGTDTGNTWASTATGADGQWRLIVVQRDDSENEIQMWFCEPGGSASKEASVADTNMGSVNGGNWSIGRRGDGNADRYYGSIACEFMKGDFALTQAEIEALAAGWAIWQLGHTPDVYLEMKESVATLRDLFGSNDATRSSAPTTVEHAPVRRAVGPMVVTREAAAAAVVPPRAYHYFQTLRA